MSILWPSARAFFRPPPAEQIHEGGLTAHVLNAMSQQGTHAPSPAASTAVAAALAAVGASAAATTGLSPKSAEFLRRLQQSAEEIETLRRENERLRAQIGQTGHADDDKSSKDDKAAQPGRRSREQDDAPLRAQHVQATHTHAAQSSAASGASASAAGASAHPAVGSASTVLAALSELTPSLEDVYRDLHRHPELSMQEHRTAKLVAEWLQREGCEVTTGVGGTGVVGVLRSGDGDSSCPTLMLRADMDALPVREDSGLAYASTATAVGPDGNEVPVMHACGHDMHVTWLLGAAALFARSRAHWRGTLLLVFQPGEETAQGARAMIDDGLCRRFPNPSAIFGQHVMPSPAGTLSFRPGTTQAAADGIDVRLFGRGAHGSMPESSVDPVVMAASVVMRLQTIVAREVAANQAAVVTVGSLQAGSKGNVIPDSATLKINVRTFDESVRRRVLAAIERIIHAEATASGAPRPPEITYTEHYPLTVNSPDTTQRVASALRGQFGAEQVVELSAPLSASEDFGAFGTAWGVPSVFWYVGGADPDVYRRAQEAGRVAEDIPTNHHPRFAPVLQPTLRMGIESLVAVALDFMRGDGNRGANNKKSHAQ
jgi:hippurate hydrolase